MNDNLGRMYGVGLMAFILFLSTSVGVPVLPQLSQELGADPTEIPIVVSAALATVVLAQFFTGTLADRFSIRAVVLAGALLGSASSLLCVVATRWTHLTALRVIGGLADAIAMPALLSITASLGKDQPGRFFGILRGSQGLSYVIAPALGSLFSFISLRAPFGVDGLLSLAAAIAALLLLKGVDEGKPEGSGLREGLRSAFSDRRVYLYLLMGISGVFSFGILASFVPAKAQLLGLKAWQIGLILSGGSLIFTLVSYAVGVLSERYGRRRFVITSQVIVVLAGVGLVFSDSFATLFLSYGLFCLGETATYLLCFVYATESFDQKHMGTSMGAFDSVMDLSLFIGPLMAVSVYKSTGRMAPVFLMAVAPAALAFFATALWLPREAEQPRGRQQATAPLPPPVPLPPPTGGGGRG